MPIPVGGVVVAALRSIGTAMTMAACGCYLARKGVLTPDITKGFAKVSMNLTIPALLFTSILNCTQDWSNGPCPDIKESIKTGWPLLFLPLINVGCGGLMGHFVVKLTKPPPDFREAVIAACAFGNSTGLPVTLLSVIHMAFPPTTKLGAVNPLLFLSVYLLLYPILQWSVGTYLMGTPDDSKAEKDEIENGSSHVEMVDLHEGSSSLVSGGGTSHGKTQLTTALIRTRSNRSASCSLKKCRNIVFKPAVNAVLLGIFIALTPMKHWLVDTKDRDDDAVMQWWFNGMINVGKAAVPINMMILGSKLNNGASFKNLNWGINLLIVLVKMVLMPCIGIATVYLIRVVGYCDSDDFCTQDASFFLVIMIVTCTPTANNIMVMAEVGGQNKEALAACIFTQYMFAPVLLAASISIFVGIAQAV